MTRTSPPLGTTFQNQLGSWVVIAIGEGRQIVSPDGSPWSHRQAVLAMRKEQGREE